jgi:Leucine Rich repeat
MSNLHRQYVSFLPETLSTRLATVEALQITGSLIDSVSIRHQIVNLVAQSPRFSSLTLNSTLQITEDMLIRLFAGSEGSLRHVDLSYCYHVGSDAIMALVAHHPNLSTLNVSHTCITDEGLLSLHNLQHLTDLSLEGCYNLTRPLMAHFLQHNLPPRLSRLNLSYLFSVQGEWLASLNSVKLERLDLRHVEHITKKDVRRLSERWGQGCEVLSTARLESDDENGWRQYIDEIIHAEVL